MFRLLPFALALPLVSTPIAAFAYIGPGAGISAIGTALALLAALALAVVGFVWYPVKRLLKLRRRSADPATAREQSKP